MFNDPLIGGALRRRTTQEVTTYEALASAFSGQPPGTMSYVKDWYHYNEETGESEFQATVHYFKRPDGTIGGHGKLDPKVIVFKGVEYVDP